MEPQEGDEGMNCCVTLAELTFRENSDEAQAGYVCVRVNVFSLILI